MLNFFQMKYFDVDTHEHLILEVYTSLVNVRGFEWLGVLRSTSQLQVDLKIFSDVEIFFYKLLRHCAGPGECSAHRFMVIRHEEKNGAAKTGPHGKVENRL